MARRRDPLDASLMRLCSLAEQTTVLLRRIERAREGFRAFRFNPDALADELTALSVVGRAAHSDRLDARRAVLVASEEGQAAAQAAYDDLGRFRERLTAIALLVDDPVVAEDLVVLRRRLVLRSPRVSGALAVYRDARDHIEHPDHAVHHQHATASIGAEVLAHVHALKAAVRHRDAAAREQRLVVDRANKAREDLRAALRRIRRMGEVAATRPSFPATLTSHLQARAVRPVDGPGAPEPQRGPRTTHDPGESTHDPGDPTHDPGGSTHDPGESTHDPGDPTHDPGESTHDPGGPSNPDFPPCSDPD